MKSFLLFLFLFSLPLVQGQEQIRSINTIADQNHGALPPGHHHGANDHFKATAGDPATEDALADEALLSASSSPQRSRALFLDVLFDLIQAWLNPDTPDDDDNNPPTPSVPTVDLPSTADFAPVRINCGGPSYEDAEGNSWLEDSYYNGMGSAASDLLNALFGAPEAGLYQTYRVNHRVWEDPLAYSIAVPNGKYEGKLSKIRSVCIASVASLLVCLLAFWHLTSCAHHLYYHLFVRQWFCTLQRSSSFRRQICAGSKFGWKIMWCSIVRIWCAGRAEVAKPWP